MVRAGTIEDDSNGHGTDPSLSRKQGEELSEEEKLRRKQLGEAANRFTLEAQLKQLDKLRRARQHREARHTQTKILEVKKHTRSKESVVRQIVESTLQIVLDPAAPKTPDYVNGWKAIKGLESLSLTKAVTIT